MVKRFSAFLAAAILFSGQILADVITIRDDAPQNYVVKKGDTLWDISQIYLNDAWQWPKLWRLNPQIENPDLIYPGDMISLVYDADGVPMLVVNRNYKKLSPTQRKIKKKDLAVPTVPLQLIRPYLSFEQSVDLEKLDSLPYVLGANENVKRATVGHVLYTSGELEVGKQYAMYRKGKAYMDPETELLLGYEITLIATGRAFREGNVERNQPSSLSVTNARKEIRAGDLLMPVTEGQSLPAFFTMRAPENNVSGSIIDATAKLREFSKTAVVVLDLGEANDVKAGHILDIVRSSPQVIDTENGPRYEEDASRYDRLVADIKKQTKRVMKETKETRYTMPRERVGQLMVFKVYENISYAMVMDTYRPVRVGDNVINP